MLCPSDSMYCKTAEIEWKPMGKPVQTTKKTAATEQLWCKGILNLLQNESNETLLARRGCCRSLASKWITREDQEWSIFWRCSSHHLSVFMAHIRNFNSIRAVVFLHVQKKIKLLFKYKVFTILQKNHHVPLFTLLLASGIHQLLSPCEEKKFHQQNVTHSSLSGLSHSISDPKENSHKISSSVLLPH